MIPTSRPAFLAGIAPLAHRLSRTPTYQNAMGEDPRCDRAIFWSVRPHDCGYTEPPVVDEGAGPKDVTRLALILMPRSYGGWRRGHGLATVTLLSLLCACATTPPSSSDLGDPAPASARVETSSAPPPTVVPTSAVSRARGGGLSSVPGRSSARVSLYAPGYDAPGALVAAVATVDDMREGTVTFDLRIPKGEATCGGPTWRHAGGVSQACWVTLPRTAGPTTMRATADLTDASGTLRTAAGTLDIQAKGVPTGPVDPSRRDAISTCGNTSDRVWLTFDDHFSSTQRMRAMLAALEQKKVRGRIFATGGWATGNPSMVSEIRAAGHLVENHTLSHEPLSSLGDQELRAQIAGGPTGDAPRLMRPGYGAGGYAARVVDMAADLGFGTCYWTVDPRDWAGPTPEKLIERVIVGDGRTPPVRAGGVVLLHMTGKHTIEALPGLIDAIRAKGLTLDPLP